MATGSVGQRLGLATLLLCLGACAPTAPGPAVRAYLFEKGTFQAIYGPDGRVLRLMQDSDGDQRADTVVVYERDGSRRAEIDTNHDGEVDRWEVYNPQNRLARVGQSRRTHGQADLWEVLDSHGSVRARELDENGDGQIDRIERFDASGLVAVELDTGNDGRMDRWQRWEGTRLVSEDLDIDGDGQPDRRLVYDASGTPRLLKLNAAEARQH
jgi:hypothetical protein